MRNIHWTSDGIYDLVRFSLPRLGYSLKQKSKFFLTMEKAGRAGLGTARSSLQRENERFAFRQLCVVVKAKPECCSEQNRNREKRLVERASVHDFALKTTIIEG